MTSKTNQQSCSAPKCKPLKGGLAQVCEKHYSLFMDYPMETGLITTIKFAKTIWRKTKLKEGKV